MKYILLPYLLGLLPFFSITSQNRLNLGVCGRWGTLNPSLLHTLAGDVVLSNQFDPLVGINDSGAIAPLAARSWIISDDFRKFTFLIDTSRRFSDGSPLTAGDFKRSWERALALNPMSANNSLQDVLYDLVGFEEAKKTETISGISAPNSETLILEFRNPFRMALSHLGGVRFSAYKEVDGGFVGTGKYSIRSVNETELELTPNRHTDEASRLVPVALRYLPGKALDEAFGQGNLDAWIYGFADELTEETRSDKNLSVVTGLEGVHKIIDVNGTPKSIFSNPKHRLALQSLIWRKLNERPELFRDSAGSRMDLQSYLPLQPGRLDLQEARKIIDHGAEFIPALLNASERDPVTVYVGKVSPWVIPLLKETGLHLSDRSREVSSKEMMDFIYKNHDYDLLSAGFSVVTGDPDGLYHALGKNGAILNPIIYRPTVGALLEEGRALLKQEDLDSHYKKVSREILKEVPFVHLGFVKSVAVYRKDRIELQGIAVRRNEGHLDVFRPLGQASP